MLSLRALYHLYSAPLERYARRIGVPEDRAWDLIQHVFLTLCKQEGTFLSLIANSPYRPWTLLCRQVDGAASNFKKQIRLEVTRHAPIEEIEAREDDHETPSQRIIKRQFLARWREALAEVPPELVVAYVSIRIEGNSVAEAAEQAGVPVGTMAWRLNEAKRWIAPIGLRLQYPVSWKLGTGRGAR